MKSAGKARSNGLYRHIRTSKEIIRNLLNDCIIKIKDRRSGPLLCDKLEFLFVLPCHYIIFFSGSLI